MMEKLCGQWSKNEGNREKSVLTYNGEQLQKPRNTGRFDKIME